MGKGIYNKVVSSQDAPANHEVLECLAVSEK